MYNRYVPQSDGSYQRNHVADPPRKPPQTSQPSCAPSQETKSPCRAPHKPEPVGNFLRQLLPHNFDTADLIIVLLILLMAGDSEEDRSTAMLTLALYLFL